jgi:hypothetical protein
MAIVSAPPHAALQNEKPAIHSHHGASRFRVAAFAFAAAGKVAGSEASFELDG